MLIEVLLHFDVTLLKTAPKLHYSYSFNLKFQCQSKLLEASLLLEAKCHISMLLKAN